VTGPVPDTARLVEAVAAVLALCDRSGSYVQTSAVRAALSSARPAEPNLRGTSSSKSWLAEVERAARAQRAIEAEVAETDRAAREQRSLRLVDGT
jgi:hypothetical protein